MNCGNKNLQYLLVPNRLEAALAVLDTDRDGHIDACEWEEAIESALVTKLEQRAAAREEQAKAAQKEIAEFTGEFLSAARQCFQLIDKDMGGSLSKDEIVKACTRRPKACPLPFPSPQDVCVCVWLVAVNFSWCDSNTHTHTTLHSSLYLTFRSF